MADSIVIGRKNLIVSQSDHSPFPRVDATLWRGSESRAKAQPVIGRGRMDRTALFLPKGIALSCAEPLLTGIPLVSFEGKIGEKPCAGE